MKQSGPAGNWPGSPGGTGNRMPSMATGAKAMQTVSQRVISDAHLLDDALYEDESTEIATLLSSTVTSQKLDGLKRLIACISVGRDVSDFFPNVVVNVAHVPFEVKNLVYIFLVRYAEKKPDEALLSINTFQKDLSDSNPRIRALALRVMSSIRVHATVPIVMLAIKKCSNDPSVYVRKAAAHAIPKVHALDHTMRDQLLEMIESMLGDRTPIVIASAVAAFLAVCPERLDLLHRHYRKLCRMMVDVEEWGQALMAPLLLRYARTQFCRPDNHARELTEEEEAAAAPGGSGGGAGAADEAATEENDEERATAKLSSMLAANKGFYSDDEDEGETKVEEEAKDSSAKEEKKGKKKTSSSKKSIQPMAEDHLLLLRCSRPLLQSRNAAVVVAVASMHFYLAPFAELPRVASALLFALRTSTPEAQHTIMACIANAVATQPSLFTPHLTAFYLKSADVLSVRLLKLEILTSLANSSSTDVNLLLQELQVYLRDIDRRTVVATIRALGRCAARLPKTATACIRSLVALTNTGDDEVAAEAVVVTRTLVQQQPRTHGAVILRLMRSIQSLKPPLARAAVVWMASGDFGQGPEVGMAVLKPEHALKLDALAPEVLRLVAGTFSEETSDTKLQLLTSVTKQRMRQLGSPMLAALHRYVVELARYDADYDVRDRARYLRMLVPPEGDDVAASALAAHAQAILLTSKPMPPLPKLSIYRAGFTMGTLSFMVQHAAPSYFALAPHPAVATNPSLREPYVGGSGGGKGGGGGGGGSRGPGGGFKTREDFYASSSSSGSGSSSSGSSSSGSGSDSDSNGFYSDDSGSGSGTGSDSDSDSDSGSGSGSGSGSDDGHSDSGSSSSNDSGTDSGSE